jgi:hypothetical protein
LHRVAEPGANIDHTARRQSYYRDSLENVRIHRAIHNQLGGGLVFRCRRQRVSLRMFHGEVGDVHAGDDVGGGRSLLSFGVLAPGATGERDYCDQQLAYLV